MISVTPQYKDAVYSPSRAADGKVIFQIVDTTAQGDASATVTSEAGMSKKDQIFNTNINPSGKYATFETNYWKLDGTFCLPPKSSESGFEVGWWSNLVSGADGMFSTPQVITVQFTADHTSIGLTVYFDMLADEYADSFAITAYDSANNVIYTVSVTGNINSKFVLEHTIQNYRKIVLTITKWAKAYRRARVAEISFGIVFDYTGNELVGMNCIEEIDTISSTVSSNEFKFTIDNSDKKFNLINPAGYYPALQRRQKIQPSIGIEKANKVYEYVPLGVYYLTEWKSDEGTLTATFTGRDILDIMAQTTYRKVLYQTRSLYNLAVDIFTDAGITDYSIDIALQSITVTGCLPVVSHREALQIIAIAGMSVVYSDRYGKVKVKQLGNTSTGEMIDYYNIYAPPQIKLDKLTNIIDVNVNAFSAEAQTSEVYKGSINISGTQDVWITYNNMAQSVSASVSGGTLNSATYYSFGALLNITASGSVAITATGYVVKKSASIYELKDSTAPSGETSLPVTVDNYLITSVDTAANVAAWILSERKKRFLYEVNWRQNPAYEAGDIVVIEDDFSENKAVRITKQEFEYQGYLSGKTSGKGGG
jgi:hypothetical protein